MCIDPGKYRVILKRAFDVITIITLVNDVLIGSDNPMVKTNFISMDQPSTVTNILVSNNEITQYLNTGTQLSNISFLSFDKNDFEKNDFTKFIGLTNNTQFNNYDYLGEYILSEG